MRPNRYAQIAGPDKVPFQAHRVLVEKILGKPLPDGAEIHHINGVKYDNRHTNLVVCENRTYHMLLHTRQRILSCGGNPDMDGYCGHCNHTKPLDEFQGVNKKSGWCKTCCAAKWRERRMAAGLPLGHFNAAKTHCKRGHEFTEENTHIRANGARVCQACKVSNKPIYPSRA